MSSGKVGGPIGVLLAQVGTPDAPTPAALRRYLREFLGDPRMLEMPAILRWLLVNLVIVPFRAPRSAALYQRIWTEGGSPLFLHSRAQARGLAARLGEGYRVELGMRYGKPSLPTALEALVTGGCARILLFPLFPQYSAATTGSVYDACFAALRRYRAIPTLRIASPFHLHPGFLQAVSARAREHAGELLRSSPVIFSFHGLPLRYVEAGDPYRDQSLETAQAIARALELAEGRWSVAFQSRFGREEWLRPYTYEEFQRLAREGRGALVVLCPSFVADCLETIDEIGEVGAEVYRRAGGGQLCLVPCVNDDVLFLQALADIVSDETRGWG